MELVLWLTLIFVSVVSSVLLWCACEGYLSWRKGSRGK